MICRPSYIECNDERISWQDKSHQIPLAHAFSLTLSTRSFLPYLYPHSTGLGAKIASALWSRPTRTCTLIFSMQLVFAFSSRPLSALRPPSTFPSPPFPLPYLDRGVWEKDELRKDDSFRTFEEVFKIAREYECDMVLLGGDLFHDNKPSRTTLVK